MWYDSELQQQQQQQHTHTLRLHTIPLYLCELRMFIPSCLHSHVYLSGCVCVCLWLGGSVCVVVCRRMRMCAYLYACVRIDIRLFVYFVCVFTVHTFYFCTQFPILLPHLAMHYFERHVSKHFPLAVAFSIYVCTLDFIWNEKWEARERRTKNRHLTSRAFEHFMTWNFSFSVCVFFPYRAFQIFLCD